jgi:ATP-dependent DNA ligase
VNIFQHLGLDENHRKQNKVTQLVKHYDEVIAKHKDKPLWIQKKEDGVCALAVVDMGSCKIFSRTGKEFQNVYKLRYDMITANLPSGVYMGEIVNDDYSLEQLSGVVNPNRTNQLTGSATQILDNMQFKMFDFVTLDEFVDGKSDVAWGKRYGQLIHNVGKAVSQVWDYSFSVIPAMLAEWGESSINAELNTAIAKGHEGIVIRDPEAGWLAGHKGWHVMKKVRGVDYDLKCIGYEEGTGKYKGKVANLIFQWKNGETIKCMLGKGWTHEAAGQMFYDIIAGSEDEISHPIGKIFQVYALDESSKGKLRLPKVGELRIDKEEPDV